METTEIKNPKDEQITNADSAVTNKDGDNDLEQGTPSHSEQDVDEQPTTFDLSTENNGDPTVQKPEDEDPSNKGKGPKGENL
ncbi:hypothetical protein [Mucilaginibacter sp. dw_454]|uniref:hypothetical protein n=1 Tax=Mucilaginibacter sp. dw_454 TaxID=2720079 RepID=UPI001BD603B0|nr:hypothetical protein [Mucilaginibacter sp. dw_454]